MTKLPHKHFPNKTADFFNTINKIIYVCGVPGIAFEPPNLPKILIIFYKNFSKLIDVVIIIFMILEVGALFTQKKLTTKQASDALLLSFSHPILYSFCLNLTYHRFRVRDLLHSLTVELKREHNDLEVEQQMIRRAKLFCIPFCFGCGISLVTYGIDGLIRVISGGSFTTVITAWPQTDDKSLLASSARIVAYVVWWMHMTRVTAAYLLVICVSICLSHQFKNLQSYFHCLNDLFVKNSSSQVEKEEKYEKGLILGIKLHNATLKCTEQLEKACSLAFSGQILVNVTVFSLLMGQMASSERTLPALVSTVSTSCIMTLSTGCFVWNAGDVTLEAFGVSTAMYMSGWQHCAAPAATSKATRVRTLLVVGVARAQKPLVMKALGIIDLSYASFVSIVKFSYSVFSVLF